MRSVLAFPADPHCGSTVGLMRDKPWQLDTEGTYTPSRTQRIIWRQWVEAWDTVKALNADRLVITVMGDCVDGKHHDTSELLTARVEEQERIFIDAMDWTLKHVGFKDSDVLQFISGTPLHTGEMAQSERRINEDMSGRGVFGRLKFTVDGVRFDCAHQRLGVGRMAWTREGPATSKLNSMLYELLEQGEDVPDYIIGAHWHQFINARIQRGKYDVTGVICPAMQMRTTYGVKVTNNSNRPPDIGVFIVVVEDGAARWICPRVKWPKERYEHI